MKRFQLCSIVLLIMLFVVFSAYSTDISSNNVIQKAEKPNEAAVKSSSADPYAGKLRVYMNEPVSRFMDDSSDYYEFGFLDFATITNITVDHGGFWDTTILWDANLVGFGDITEDNIKATVVLFDDEYTLADAYPPNNYYFLAYHAEAAAGATVGTYGQNKTDGAFTHTVFIEELTATW